MIEWLLLAQVITPTPSEIPPEAVTGPISSLGGIVAGVVLVVILTVVQVVVTIRRGPRSLERKQEDQ
jgi:heme/copper-type cytochrome/quinol oxidase subunit 2